MTESNTAFDEMISSWYELFGPRVGVTKNWAPTRDGVTCNTCHKAVHYDTELCVHIHDDPAANSCISSQNHGRVRRAELKARDLERMRFAFNAGREAAVTVYAN